MHRLQRLRRLDQEELKKMEEEEEEGEDQMGHSNDGTVIPVGPLTLTRSHRHRYLVFTARVPTAAAAAAAGTTAAAAAAAAGDADDVRGAVIHAAVLAWKVSERSKSHVTPPS